MFGCSDHPDGALLDVRVIPRAAQSALAGERNGALLVRLNAPPVEGAANTELVALLSTVLGVPKRQIAIVSGERTRNKRVRISGMTAAAVRQRVESHAR